MVATEDETFVLLSDSFSKNVEIIENLPIYCKIDLPRQDNNREEYRLGLPLSVYVHSTETSTTDVQVYYSMDTKEPSAKAHEKKGDRKRLQAGHTFRSTYNNLAPEEMKYPNAVYFCLMSVRGCNCEVTACFSKIRNKVPGEVKLG